MPKKNRPPSDSDQPELPLENSRDADFLPGRGGPDVVPPAPSTAATAAELAAAPAAPVSAGSEPVAELPKRRGGNNVQTEDSPLAKSYRGWFLEYASYVILDRAVPHLGDGLKPVQRRILHTLWDMDDGRFHKVANIVGRSMSLHPHGDASIGAALVAIGQRGFLIEPQGNFGNSLTGDEAAAPRYIEARLTPFAKDVLFNPKTTHWQLSYDGRAQEPVTLPAKFPIVLLDGAEGIAVGLSTKILPHNFNDLCRAAINHLNGKTFRIFPDFPSGGIADFAEYNDGERGGKVKIRAKIEVRSKYILAITELPYGTTTETLIESILAANAKGKIKVKHVDDNTSETVEILVHLPQGSDPEQVIQQLFVFTGCQQNISPAACVIVSDDKTGEDKPEFLGVREILRRNVDQTKALLQRELAIKLEEHEQQWHGDSLERIFIEERIYRRIEKSKTWDSVLAEIREGLQPFIGQLRRPVSDDDITRLTEIRIKRISAFNRFQADEAIKRIEEGIKATKTNLRNLTAYAVAWFEMLQEKYGKGLRRRTSYDEIQQINAAEVVSVNQRLYVNREDGFIGLNWRQHEFVQECTILDIVLTFMRDGSLKVAKVADKVFMGRDIIHCAILPKDGDGAFYSMIYQDKETGKAFAKRFQIGGLSRDKLYSLVKSEGASVVYFQVSPTEKTMPKKLRVLIDGRSGARVRELAFDLTSVPVRHRAAKGLTVTKWPIKEVKCVDEA